MDRQKWVSLQRMGRGVLGAEGGGGGDSGGGGGLASAFGGMGCEAVMLLDASRTLDSYGALTSDTEVGGGRGGLQGCLEKRYRMQEGRGGCRSVVVAVDVL